MKVSFGYSGKCEIHHENLTLYCLFDKKLCCIDCVHKETSHKRHNVVGIKQATELISREIGFFKNEIKDK